MHVRGGRWQRPSDERLQEHPGAGCSRDWAVEGRLAPGCAPGPGTEGRGGTFLDPVPDQEARLRAPLTPCPSGTGYRKIGVHGSMSLHPTCRL